MNSPDKFDKSHPLRRFTHRLNKTRLYYSSQNLGMPGNYYVGWLDVMGAGSLMQTSMQKTANCLVRLHMSVELARQDTGFGGRIVTINDGVFVITDSKAELMSLFQTIMIHLAARFIETIREQDRFLVRGGIAYGPVIFGSDLEDGIGPKKARRRNFLSQIQFGPAISLAYKAESSAPPFGIHVDVSARSFSSAGARPFQQKQWLWWQSVDGNPSLKNLPSLTDLRDCLALRLEEYFDWLESSLVHFDLKKEKLDAYRQACTQYFFHKS